MPPVKDEKRKAAEKLSKERGHLVVKRNDFVQKSRHKLSLQEQKIVQYLISYVKPNDENFTEHRFSIAEFCRFCGMDEKNGKNYHDIKEALKTLRDRSVWVEIEDGVETTLGWINKATINKRSGTVMLKLDEDLKPFLLLLHEQYTMYEIHYTLAMKSKYSIRLYELLKSYAFKKTVVLEMNELKRLLDAENYKLNGHFKAKVLDIAIREINEYTDIAVEYNFQKDGNRYTHVWFGIDRKEAADRFIAGSRVGQAIGNKPSSRQMSLAEAIDA